MDDTLRVGLTALSLVVALVAVVYVVRDRSADGFLVGLVGVLFVGTLAQLVYGIAQLPDAEDDVNKVVFVLYLLGLVATPPVAAWWARGRAEPGRRRSRGGRRAARPVPAAAPGHPVGRRCLTIA